MNDKTYYIFDFDSTLTRVEALDLLAEIALKDHPERDERIQAIKDITVKGVNGELSFDQSLIQRIQLLEANKNQLPELICRLKDNISLSVLRNLDFFETHQEQIRIVSAGFKEFIEPIADLCQIPTEHIYANTFEYDAAGTIIGVDESNPLSQHNGKIQCVKDMQLDGDIFMIGDSYSDYAVKEGGVAKKFFAYTENVERENIIDKADAITPSLDEFLYINNLPMAVSYPKNRIKIMLLEGIHAHAEQRLIDDGYDVVTIKDGMDEAQLAEAIKDVSVLGIRSKTQITEHVLTNANKLLAIGAFCIGINQIDLNACARKGIAVFNAPYSNTRSVVELAVGEIIMLMRRTLERSIEMRQGHWNKTAKNSFEVRGKKLGIIGYGNIGSQLSVVAEALGMKVYYYDIVEKLALGNAKKLNSMDELLTKVDVVSLHVDGRPSNKNLIDEKAFQKMKDGVYFINLSRGHIVDIDALEKNLNSGKVAGAGLDVFPEEPRVNQGEFDASITQCPNIILTPHVGGSTVEAQYNIADFVPGKLMDYINTGNTFDSVNFPNIQLPHQEHAHRLLHIHENVPGILAKVNSVLAKYEMNILGQYLKTSEEIGYLITDVDQGYNNEVIKELSHIKHTIKFRVLY